MKEHRELEIKTMLTIRLEYEPTKKDELSNGTQKHYGDMLISEKKEYNRLILECVERERRKEIRCAESGKGKQPIPFDGPSSSITQ